MERLVKHTRTLIDVDNHRGAAFAAEVALEESSQLTLPERNDPGVVPERKIGKRSPID